MYISPNMFFTKLPNPYRYHIICILLAILRTASLHGFSIKMYRSCLNKVRGSFLNRIYVGGSYRQLSSGQRLSNVQVLRSRAQQILCSLGRSQRLSPGSLSALYMWFLMCCPLLQLFLAHFTIRQWRMLLWLLTEVCGFTDISLPTEYELANILKGRNQKGLDSGLRILQTCACFLNKYQNSKKKGSLEFRMNH